MTEKLAELFEETPPQAQAKRGAPRRRAVA